MSHGRHDPVQRLNDHHADDLLVLARAFGGHPDAISARAERVDREGADLVLDTPRGPATTRVAFTEPVADDSRRGLRAAFADLARRARAALAADSNESSAS
jgi:hypothetical protein